jgi:hypothetical protein
MAYLKGRFGMFSQGETKETNPFVELSSVKYGGEIFRLFLFYVGVLEYDNKIKHYTQRQIAELTGMARENVNKANKILLNHGIIYADGKDYYMDEKYFLKGLKRYKRKR